MDEWSNDEFYDEVEVNEEVTDVTPETEEPSDVPEESSNFIDSFLKTIGIEDKSKIKFENEDGEVEEVHWDSLSEEDKLNIMRSSDSTVEDGLDDDEIELLNAIRSSRLSPAEYLKHILDQTIQQYTQNSQTQQFEVDQYTDDELFVMDFISRMGDVTDDEAYEALEKAKANETLYKKQIGAIRREYQQIEADNLRQAEFEQEQRAQEEYKQFTDTIVDQINDFTEVEGYDLNMENEDMQNLYEFITGYDAAGVNHFTKALSDPKTLVETAWFALNGRQMINDITEYFQKEITSVRKESYNKGVKDAQEKIGQSNVVYKNKSTKSDYYDLDDF